MARAGCHWPPVPQVAASPPQQRPSRLPERQKLPPEAKLSARALRAIHASIDKGLAKAFDTWYNANQESARLAERNGMVRKFVKRLVMAEFRTEKEALAAEEK